jgi:RNA polymerase sigma factor (sigma-70 family)
VASTNARTRAIAAFYAGHANRVQRTVASRVRAPQQTIEDACQTAWTMLLLREDIDLDHRGAAWIATVATHQALQLVSQRREVPVGAFMPWPPEPGIVTEPADDTSDPGDVVAARDQYTQRVRDLALLKPREREALYLKALGYSYHEIAQLTNATYTAVNRRINEGRARLRKLAREHDAARDAN